MIGLGLGLVGQAVRNASGQGWTPAALFANGEQGVWYEPKPEYLYQDAAGTTPVTADGDPVGLMLDLSGNGNHATQSTSAARPIYRTDGTLHWLEFDGVDDTLEVSDVSIFSDDEFLLSKAVNLTDSALNSRIFAYGGRQGNDESKVSLTDKSLDGQGRVTMRRTDDLNYNGPLADFIATDNLVLSYTLLDGFDTGWVNSDLVDDRDNTGLLPPPSINRISIFSRGDSTSFCKGQLYGVVFCDRHDDPKNTEKYLATRAGITL